jgi:hypothetical protein
MRIQIVAFFLPAVLLMTGCDEQAQRFATETNAILEQRSCELSKKIAAETQAYNDYAAKAAEDRRTLAIRSLSNENAERADALAADYRDRRKPVSLWRKDLSEAAQVAYETNKGLLTTDLDAEASYLQRYQSLTIEQDKVDALAKLLDALAKKQSLKDEAAALEGFAADTNKAFDSKVCAALKPKTDAASKKLYKDDKCDTSK